MNKNVVKTQVFAKHLAARITPKKLGPVLDLVRGLDLERAKLLLAFDSTKAAKLILKVVKSAEANAVNNNKMDPKKLFVSEMHAGPGPTYKRFRIVAKSRVSPLLKRTSNIYVGLSERNK